jgi:magnesium-transporting ATPase (P-type)
MVEPISISGGKPVMAAPLSAVVAASMIKDAFEDYKRHKNDNKENETQTLVYNFKTQRFHKCAWKNVFCGDIVKVTKD